MARKNLGLWRYKIYKKLISYNFTELLLTKFLINILFTFFCYLDELPCLKFDVPKGCNKDAGDDEDDGWGDDGMEIFL